MIAMALVGLSVVAAQAAPPAPTLVSSTVTPTVVEGTVVSGQSDTVQYAGTDLPNADWYMYRTYGLNFFANATTTGPFPGYHGSSQFTGTIGNVTYVGPATVEFYNTDSTGTSPHYVTNYTVIPLTPTFTSTPSNPSNSNSASFTASDAFPTGDYSGTPECMRFEWRIDGGSWTLDSSCDLSTSTSDPAISNKTFSSLSAGSHTVDVRVYQESAATPLQSSDTGFQYPSASASYTWTVNEAVSGTATCGTSDDSSSIQSTLNAATTTSNSPIGPSGAAQAVVRLPAASTCRSNNVAIPSNVRLEIPADTTVEPIVSPTSGNPMFVAGQSGHVDNITITTVPGSTNALSNGNRYVVDRDPRDSQSNLADRRLASSVSFALFQDVAYYEFSNGQMFDRNDFVLSTDPANHFDNRTDSTEQNSVQSDIRLKSSLGDAESYPNIPSDQPDHGTITNMLVTNATFGYGLVQVVGADDLTISNSTESGGTLCRMEDSQTSAETKNVITGVLCHDNAISACNALGSAAAHSQVNGTVEYYNNTSTACQYAVKMTDDGASTGSFAEAYFHNNTLVQGGSTAQKPDAGLATWATAAAISCHPTLPTGWPTTIINPNPGFGNNTRSPSGWTSC